MSDLEQQDEPLTFRHWCIFAGGLLVYAVGFMLLAASWSNLAPFLIVGGMTMQVVAFLI